MSATYAGITVALRLDESWVIIYYYGYVSLIDESKYI